MDAGAAQRKASDPLGGGPVNLKRDSPAHRMAEQVEAVRTHLVRIVERDSRHVADAVGQSQPDIGPGDRRAEDDRPPVRGSVRFRDLHVFFTVVEHGSMGKAAQILNISQPAISRSIAELENALGVLRQRLR